MLSEPRVADRSSLEAVDATALVDDAVMTGALIRGSASFGSADAVEVAESRFVNARLSGMAFERLRLTDVVLEDCDLSGTALTAAALWRVELRGCRMTGADLSGARLRDVRFADCKLDDLNLRMVAGERVAFADCVMNAADLYAAKLRGATFFDCNLTGAQFAKGDFRDARFHGSTLADAGGADHLRGAVIDPSQVVTLALATFAALGIAVDEDRE